MATGETIYRGEWWLPGHEDEAQPGSLIVAANGYPRLELIRGFETLGKVPVEGRPGRSTMKDVGNYPTIFGLSGELHFTILAGQTVSVDDSLIDAPRNHVISGSRAIKGERFLTDDAEQAVLGVGARFDHLINFAQLSGFSWNDERKWEVGEVSSSGSYTRQPDLKATWKGTEFTLGFSDFTRRQDKPDIHELSAIEHAYLNVDFARPVTLHEADQYVARIEDLLTIALGRPCAVRSAKYQFPMPEAVTELEKRRAEYRSKYHMEAFGQRVFPPDKNPYIPLHSGVLFTLRQLPFGQVIPAWMDIYDRAETGIQMLCGTWYMDGGYVSTRLMNVCAAMESIHSGLYDRPRMPEKDWEALERQALAGVGESEDRRALHELLNNRMFFKQRALDLAAHIGDQAAAELLGDVEMWAELATKRRNVAAHALRRSKADRVPGRDLFLALVTRSLLCLVLIKELGLDNKTFRYAVQQMWPVSSRWKEVSGQA